MGKQNASTKAFVTAMLLLFHGSSHAVERDSSQEPRPIGWADLTVTVKFEDPFETLAAEQLMQLSTYARVTRLQQQAGDKVSEEMSAEAADALALLTADGIDVPGLLKRREEIKQLRKQRATATNPDLDGTTISMPGYALPLEYDGKKATEFLLVPWVGACIHTPPPPPNQIVHVVAATPFESKGMFEAVTVTGVMKIGDRKSELYLVDGTADINMTYAMTGAGVEKYKKE